MPLPLGRRTHASVLHLDLDAFFASVEQRDKPSLRGKPVIVGGTAGRGVVATASYEARVYGVRSAMSTREARARCPHAAYLRGRFDAYREASGIVMRLLREVSPLVEPLSLDEAFVDLAAADDPLLPDLETETVRAFAQVLRDRVHEATGGLTASVGLATSKFVAKVASDLDKPDGLRVVPPGTEQELLRPMAVTVIPGVGPATAERLRRAGVRTVADLEGLGLDELVSQVGKAHGAVLHSLARARDERPVVAERETKSVSAEGTYETDIVDVGLMAGLLARQAGGVAERLRSAGLSGRTITIKVRLADFTTVNRSATLPAPVDDGATVARVAKALLTELATTADLGGGVRLLGVGVSGLADWVQEDLFSMLEPDPQGPDAQPAPVVPAGLGETVEVTTDDGHPADPTADPTADSTADPVTAPTGSEADPLDEPLARFADQWPAGADVEHDEHGRGWVWGSGRGVVTVRFETASTPPGPVRSFKADDPALHPWRRSPAAEPPAAEPAAGPAAPGGSPDGR
ncbi:DNA polymerase IV [Nocardioides alkalitolerans]|uniref:DNA polymerase IV n=1 Tax=Nocardioides alkalitolerans TaxID=281714 RepID=UPI0004007D22|nr:DNA polymerase IV [Nocardioides alkalitolerans]